MLTVRPYKEEDAAACGDCFYEGFFSCSVDQNDKMLLRDYAHILIEKCNFTYVAETEDHQVVGFICGKYDKHFSKALAGQHHSRNSLMLLSVSHRKGIRKPLGNAIWNWLPFRPEGITERGWEPHWSHNF